MSMNYHMSSHVFGNRLYIAAASQEEIRESIYLKRDTCLGGVEYKQGMELKGAGVRCYSKPIGWLLSLINVSSKISFCGKDFYINNKSFSKLMMRKAELASGIAEAAMTPEEATAIKAQKAAQNALTVSYRALEKNHGSLQSARQSAQEGNQSAHEALRSYDRALITSKKAQQEVEKAEQADRKTSRSAEGLLEVLPKMLQKSFAAHKKTGYDKTKFKFVNNALKTAVTDSKDLMNISNRVLSAAQRGGSKSGSFARKPKGTQAESRPFIQSLAAMKTV